MRNITVYHGHPSGTMVSVHSIVRNMDPIRDVDTILKLNKKIGMTPNQPKTKAVTIS
jgi:hypothetical protein